MSMSYLFKTTLRDGTIIIAERTSRRFLMPAAALVCLWGLCVVISVIGFHNHWGRFPDSIDLIMGNSLLAPFAIPKSLGDTVGITDSGSTRGTLMMMACFWPVVLALTGIVMATRSKICYCALAIVMVVAAIHWQVVAAGMLGI